MEKHVFGIYRNIKELKVSRINSPYWIPQPPDWIFLMPEVNMPLSEICELIKSKKLAANTDVIDWV